MTWSDDLDDEIYRSRNPRAKHGTRAGYLAGCRCSDCTRANREYGRAYDRAHYDPAKRRERYEKTGRDWYLRQRDGGAA